MKNEDDKRKGAGVYEKNENVNTWATIAKRLTNEKTIEKLERVEESMMMNKSDVQKQVEESTYEARRKKRIIVFNMQEKEEKTDREQVLDMIGDMGERGGGSRCGKNEEEGGSRVGKTNYCRV